MASTTCAVDGCVCQVTRTEMTADKESLTFLNNDAASHGCAAIAGSPKMMRCVSCLHDFALHPFAAAAPIAASTGAAATAVGAVATSTTSILRSSNADACDDNEDEGDDNTAVDLLTEPERGDKARDKLAIRRVIILIFLLSSLWSRACPLAQRDDWSDDEAWAKIPPRKKRYYGFCLPAITWCRCAVEELYAVATAPSGARWSP